MNKNLKKKLPVLLLIILTLSFCLSGIASARAGGGGSSGGSSGGGGSHSTHRYHNRSGSGNPAAILVHGVIFLIAGSGTILLTYRSRKAKRQSIQLMNAYRKLGINWDYQEIQKHVEKAYFQIQEAWRRYDPSYASFYLSEELAEKWRTQLEWMQIRREEIVQENVRLLSAVPVDVHDETGEERDHIWYLIHGKMVGYYRNLDTKELIRGNPKPEAFYEYWLFVYRDGRWVLHEIRQQNEMDIQEFLNN